MSISNFTMYLFAITMLADIVRDINNDFNLLIHEFRLIEEFFNFLETDYSEDDKEVNDTFNDDAIEIKFSDVSFKYPRTNRYVLKNINFTINKREKIAIVGLNGSGKTTIVKLLSRFYKPSSGEIYLNGININDIEKEKLYSIYSNVFQDVNIFPFTIRENITSSDTNIDLNNLDESIYLANLKDKIDVLKNGMDSKLLKNINDGGIDLSGGEKQKIAIARAIYKNGTTSIFDEPTAALDPIAEMEAFENIKSISKDRTTILISHRMYSCKICNKKLVINKGKVHSYGRHDELIKDIDGLYYNLYSLQAKSYSI